MGVREMYSVSSGKSRISNNNANYHMANNIFLLWKMPVTFLGGKLLVTMAALYGDEGTGTLHGCGFSF